MPSNQRPTQTVDTRTGASRTAVLATVVLAGLAWAAVKIPPARPLLVIVAAAMALVFALVLAWKLSFPCRATKVLIALGAERNGQHPRLRRMWRRGWVWHVAWRMPPGVTVTTLARSSEAVAQALDCSVEWWFDRRLVHLRAGTHRLPKRVEWAKFHRRARVVGELPVVIGMSREGPKVVDLVDLPHLLTGGSTGYGKSVFIRQCLTDLLLRLGPGELRLALGDFKGGLEFNLYDGLPHLLGPVARDAFAFLDRLSGVVAELERRQAMFEATGVETIQRWNEVRSDQRLPYVIVAVDEVAELSAAESYDEDAKKAKKAALGGITRLVRLGRALGIHVLLSTQRPDAEVVPGQIKANIPATVAFRVRSEVNSRILLGDGDSTAAALPPTPGRGIFQLAKNVEFQGPWLSKEDARALLERAYPECVPLTVVPEPVEEPAEEPAA